MLNRVKLAVAEIVSAVRFFHSDVISHNVSVNARKVHSFFQFVVIDGEARYCFHQATSPGIFSLQAKIKLMFSNAAISLRFLK